MISIIVAMGRNRAIGKDNQLIWHLPADLKHFRETTMGCPIIMGRKTFESVGKPLPGRKNIIVTRNSEFKASGCLIAGSLDQAMEMVAEGEYPEKVSGADSSVRFSGDKSRVRTPIEKEVFIAGGGEIYRQAILFADRLYITVIDHDFEGDTFFPSFSADEWVVIDEKKHEADDRNRHTMLFRIYKRINNVGLIIQPPGQISVKRS